MTWTQTHSGKAFDLLSPDPALVDILDIAHSLSLQCRFNGHCKMFYSVAQHSVFVADLLPEKLQLAGLLHDAAEAYIGDCIRPLKQLLPNYRNIEQGIENAISSRFGIPYPWPDEVLQADLIALATEARDLMSPPPQPWESLPHPVSRRVNPWTAEAAKEVFVQRFNRLYSQRRLRDVSGIIA